jgi:DNA-binding MarR family transcriptional regulator
MGSLVASDAVVEGILRTIPRWARFLGQELEQLDPPLSVRQFLVLQRIDAGTSRTTDLARTVRVTSPTMTRVIDRLVETGLVMREADPDDRRAIRLGLTPAGRRVLARHSRTLAAGIRRLLDEAGATHDELGAVNAACEILSGALDIRRAKESAATTPKASQRPPQRVG